MQKKEIYDMVIQELIEKALSVRRETCSSDEKQFYETLKEKSERTRGVLKQLSEEEYQIVDDYMVTTNLIAQKECEYLYVQGAKDCVELLKKLGMLQKRCSRNFIAKFIVTLRYLADSLLHRK